MRRTLAARTLAHLPSFLIYRTPSPRSPGSSARRRSRALSSPSTASSSAQVPPLSGFSVPSPRPWMHVSLSVTYPSALLSRPLTGLDLHDLHELRARVLVFIHDLTSSLRANGVRPPPSGTLGLTSTDLRILLAPSLAFVLLPCHGFRCWITRTTN